MKKNINLTVEEIHKIREEHYQKTKNMTFEEYKLDLKTEIAPVLEMLNKIREAKKLQEA